MVFFFFTLKFRRGKICDIELGRFSLIERNIAYKNLYNVFFIEESS